MSSPGRHRPITPPPSHTTAPGGVTRLLQALVVLLVCATLVAVTFLVRVQTDDPVLIGYWLLGAFVIAASLMAFVIGKRYEHLPVAPGKVLCIVPAYNEDPDGLRATIQALLRQTQPVDVIVIDDGSAIPVVPSVEHPRVRWLRQENTGKRGAQVAVLSMVGRDAYDFVLTVDSDSEPYPDACEHLLRAMADPDVEAATGWIFVRNYRDSWISRATDMDIGGSCVMMRASRSYLGALETTSGALAMYRTSLLFDHLDAYAVECGTGDDRWLALRALRRGQVVGVAEALVETEMPSTYQGTYRQRLRWARSWWWMLPYVMRYLRPHQLLSPIYGLMQLVITPAMIGYIAVSALLNRERYSEHLGALAVYLGAYVLVRYSISALYLIGRPRMSRGQKLRSWLIGTPASVFLNMILLVPTRYLALFKLFDNRWQTREVEVPDGTDIAVAAPGVQQLGTTPDPEPTPRHRPERRPLPTWRPALRPIPYEPLAPEPEPAPWERYRFSDDWDLSAHDDRQPTTVGSR